MPISRQQVQYLAHLARLELTDEELDRFAPQLDEILSYVEKLKKVTTEGIPPTSHVLKLTNVFREDQVQPSTPNAPVLENAPDREGSFFRVPKILDAS